MERRVGLERTAAWGRPGPALASTAAPATSDPGSAAACLDGEGVVSLCAEVPEALLVAMRGFIARHPHWDQYRLFQAALAGFLVQNGVRNRGITRCYLANLFPGQGAFDLAPGES